MFIEDGFRKENDNYIKRTVVGATLLDSITETHTIKSYENFKTDVRDFTKDFAMPQGLDYTTIGFEGMQALLKQAMDSVPKEYAKIFGERDDDGNWKNAKYEKQYMKSEPYEKPMVRYDLATQQNVFYTVEKTRSIPTVETLDYNSYVTYQKALEDLSDDERGEKGQNERIVVTGNGLFTEWVGYAPVMKPGADPGVDVEDYQKNVRFDGSGQTGRIMGMYIQHKMIEGAGWAECEQPAYSRRLWDDRGSWMKAPTIRSVVDVAMNIAATAFAPGVGQIMLNLVDDAVFTMLDVANGMDLLTAAEGLAKKAAVGLVTNKINMGFANGKGLLNNQMLGSGVIGETLTKGLQISMTNVASSGVNAFSVTNALNGGCLFDGDAFMEGAFGKSAMASVASGMAGQAVTGTLGKYNLKTNGGIFFSKSSDAISVDALNAFNGTMGNLASTAVTWGMTGNASVNLLNASMLGMKGKNNSLINGGLFEVSFGKDGFHGAVSSAGTDMNLGKLASAFKGYEQSRRIFELKAGGKTGNATLETIAALDYTLKVKNHALSKDLFDGKKSLELTDGVAKDGTTYAGMVNSDTNPSVIKMNQALLGSMSKEEIAKFAAIVSHEGAHLSGEHVESAAYKFGGESYVQMVQNMGLKGDSGFLSGILDAMKRPENQTANAGGDEYWLLTKDGRLLNDGRKGLKQEMANGKLKQVVSDNQESSVSEALVHYLGQDRAKELLNRSYGGLFDWGDQSTHVNTYDNQTLRDVLKLNDTQIAEIRNDPKKWETVIGNADLSQKDKLIGEALMKQSGIETLGSGWNPDTPGKGLALTDKSLTSSSVFIRSLGNGKYEKFTVDAYALRGSDAFKVLVPESDPNKQVKNQSTGEKFPWAINDDYKDNTTIGFIKRDLNGNVIDKPYIPDARWNTVDVGVGQISGSTYDERITYPGLGDIQSNTVISNYSIRLTDHNSTTWGVSDVFLMTNADTIGGERINNDGKIPNSPYQSNRSDPFYWHPAGQGTNDGCWTVLNTLGYNGNFKDINKIGSAAYNFLQMTNYLQQWGVYKDINIPVYQGNLNPWISSY